MRQLGLYKGGFPSNPDMHSSFEKQLLRGGDILLGESFVGGTWASIERGNGIYSAWNSWLSQNQQRRAVYSVAMFPDYGPEGTWTTKKGTTKEVSDSLAKAALGKYDFHWVIFADKLPIEFIDAIIRLGWEFNGNWYPSRAAPNPTAWAAYWRRIAKIIKARHPGVSMDWNIAGSMNLKADNGTTTQNVMLAYPGDDVVDIFGIDKYDLHYGNTKYYGWDRNTYPDLAKWAAEAKAHGKPVSIPEWGVWDRSRNTRDWDNDWYIKKMHEWIHMNNVLYHVYFDTTAHDGDHKLTTPTQFPKAAEMFKSLTWKLTP